MHSLPHTPKGAPLGTPRLGSPKSSFAQTGEHRKDYHEDTKNGTKAKRLTTKAQRHEERHKNGELGGPVVSIYGSSCIRTFVVNAFSAEGRTRKNKETDHEGTKTQRKTQKQKVRQAEFC